MERTSLYPRLKRFDSEYKGLHSFLCRTLAQLAIVFISLAATAEPCHSVYRNSDQTRIVLDDPQQGPISVGSFVRPPAPYVSLHVEKMLATFKDLSQRKDLPFEVTEATRIGTDGLNEFPIYKFTSKPQTSVKGRVRKIFITGGIHGNEPVSVLTALDLVNALSTRAEFQNKNIEWTVLPALNIEGLMNGRRHAQDGTDFNRTFHEEHWHPASKKLVEAFDIKKEDVALALDLHGSVQRLKFFVIKAGEDGGLALAALKNIDPAHLLLTEEGQPTGYVGAPAANGTVDKTRYLLEAPGLSTSSNKGTIKGFLKALGITHTYTVEYPGSIPYEQAREINFELSLALIRQALAGSH